MQNSTKKTVRERLQKRSLRYTEIATAEKFSLQREPLSSPPASNNIPRKRFVPSDIERPTAPRRTQQKLSLVSTQGESLQNTLPAKVTFPDILDEAFVQQAPPVKSQIPGIQVPAEASRQVPRKRHAGHIPGVQALLPKRK